METARDEEFVRNSKILKREGSNESNKKMIPETASKIFSASKAVKKDRKINVQYLDLLKQEKMKNISNN